jgi:hypothetical protein
LHSTGKPVSARLSDMTGAVVKSISDLNSATEVNVSELPSGIYFLRLNSGEAAYTKRIVKL